MSVATAIRRDGRPRESRHLEDRRVGDPLSDEAVADEAVAFDVHDSAVAGQDELRARSVEGVDILCRAEQPIAHVEACERQQFAIGLQHVSQRVDGALVKHGKPPKTLQSLAGRLWFSESSRYR